MKKGECEGCWDCFFVVNGGLFEKKNELKNAKLPTHLHTFDVFS